MRGVLDPASSHLVQVFEIVMAIQGADEALPSDSCQVILHAIQVKYAFELIILLFCNTKTITTQNDMRQWFFASISCFSFYLTSGWLIQT